MENLSNTLGQLSQEEEAIDVMIHCQNKTIFKANKIVLSNCSSLLKNILYSDCHCANFIPVTYNILCPDFNPEAMQKVLELIYKGTTYLTPENLTMNQEINTIIVSLHLNIKLEQIKTQSTLDQTQLPMRSPKSVLNSSKPVTKGFISGQPKDSNRALASSHSSPHSKESEWITNSSSDVSSSDLIQHNVDVTDTETSDVIDLCDQATGTESTMESPEKSSELETFEIAFLKAVTGTTNERECSSRNDAAETVNNISLPFDENLRQELEPVNEVMVGVDAHNINNTELLHPISNFDNTTGFEKEAVIKSEDGEANIIILNNAMTSYNSSPISFQQEPHSESCNEMESFQEMQDSEPKIVMNLEPGLRSFF